MCNASPLQAFSIPVIQIVYETLKDQQEGKKGRTSIKSGGASEHFNIHVLTAPLNRAEPVFQSGVRYYTND